MLFTHWYFMKPVVFKEKPLKKKSVCNPKNVFGNHNKCDKSKGKNSY